MNPCDYFLQSYLKYCVYSINLHTVQALHTEIEAITKEITCYSACKS